MLGFRLRLDTARVAFEDVDGEIIVIDFKSGTYFSLQNTAAEIWRQLVAGASPAAIESGLAAVADQDPQARAAVAAFIAELVANRLLVETAVPALVTEVEFSAFEAPVLEKFEDMAELIQLDPIHEVTEAGWPHANV